MGNKYGLPLVTNSTQTILPVIVESGLVVGFYTIQKTTFSNPVDNTFNLNEGLIVIKTVTLPNSIITTNGPTAVNQYVAAYVTQNDVYKRPWLGFTAFIDPMSCGEFHRWSLPSYGLGLNQNDGLLISALKVNLNTTVTAQPVPNAPNPQPAALSWNASASVNTFNVEQGFFDFNWVTLFKQSNTGLNPMRITAISNTSSGQLKSTVVATQSVIEQGAIIFDTVRIILLRNISPGSYIFNFVVTDSINQSTNVAFTLNIS